MKKRVFVILLGVFLLLTSACSKFTYSFTQKGNNIKIEVNNAEDGKEAESNYFSVGKNKVVTLESSLEKGQLQIDFTSVTVFTHTDEDDEVIYGDVVESVVLGPGDTAELKLEKGDYILQIISIGNTNGTVTMNINKE